MDGSVFAVEFDELVVGALFDDASVLQNENAIGVTNGGETMGDGEDGATVHELVDGGLNLAFGNGV